MSVQSQVAEAVARAASPRCLTTNLGWLLAQASHAYGCEVSAALEPLELGSRGVCVLSTALGGEFTQTQLANLIGLDKTMLMVTVDELERLGLAERRPSATDRRARIVTVTDAGMQKLAEAQEIIETVEAEVLGGLPADEREAFLGALIGLVSGRLSEPAECHPALRRREPRQ
ncbi:MAG: MarR family transcriptional regulator [Actinomycetota bacterium]|nr:MarR family transcriptional regulator [Actinomycetota bacterium]